MRASRIATSGVIGIVSAASAAWVAGTPWVASLSASEPPRAGAQPGAGEPDLADVAEALALPPMEQLALPPIGAPDARPCFPLIAASSGEMGEIGGVAMGDLPGVSVAAPQCYPEGEQITVTATPRPGFVFAAWSVLPAGEGIVIGDYLSPTITFAMPGQPIALFPQFAPAPQAPPQPEVAPIPTPRAAPRTSAAPTAPVPAPRTTQAPPAPREPLPGRPNSNPGEFDPDPYIDMTHRTFTPITSHPGDDSLERQYLDPLRGGDYGTATPIPAPTAVITGPGVVLEPAPGTGRPPDRPRLFLPTRSSTSAPDRPVAAPPSPRSLPAPSLAPTPDPGNERGILVLQDAASGDVLTGSVIEISTCDGEFVSRKLIAEGWKEIVLEPGCYTADPAISPLGYAASGARFTVVDGKPFLARVLHIAEPGAQPETDAPTDADRPTAVPSPVDSGPADSSPAVSGAQPAASPAGGDLVEQAGRRISSAVPR